MPLSLGIVGVIDIPLIYISIRPLARHPPQGRTDGRRKWPGRCWCVPGAFVCVFYVVVVAQVTQPALARRNQSPASASGGRPHSPVLSQVEGKGKDMSYLFCRVQRCVDCDFFCMRFRSPAVSGELSPGG